MLIAIDFLYTILYIKFSNFASEAKVRAHPTHDPEYQPDNDTVFENNYCIQIIETGVAEYTVKKG